MRRSRAAQYARWAAAAAILLAVGVAGVYVRRAWQRAQARRAAPAVVPATVQKRSAEFSFSRVEGERTIFTVRASRATEFKEGGKNLLEDVRITIFGRDGKRHDEIHTRECDYVVTTGNVTCAGEVQMNIESAASRSLGTARRTAKGEAGRLIHIGTSNVFFNRESGQARSDRPVMFRFPQGRGRAVGVSYHTREGKLMLHRDVEFTLDAPPLASEGQPVIITGTSLEFQRGLRTLHLEGPVRAVQGGSELSAAALEIELDAEQRARRGVATGRPQYVSAEAGEQTTLAADEFVATFRRDGSVERIEAAKNVQGARRATSVPRAGAVAEETLHAQRLVLDMAPGTSQPAELNAEGGVVVASRAAGEMRRLETAGLRLHFLPAAAGPGRGAGRSQIARGETLAPAAYESVSGGVTTKVRGERLNAEFGADNHLRQLTGRSGVEIERAGPDSPSAALRAGIGAGASPETQTVTARELVMKFGAAGSGSAGSAAGVPEDWSEAELSGDVRYREGAHRAEAGRARMMRAQETLTMTGGAMVFNGASRTKADRLTFNQRTGELAAEGGVTTTYAGPGSAAQGAVRAAELAAPNTPRVAAGSAAAAFVPDFSAQPAHIAAARLTANRDAGRAFYSGGARLWQGDAVIEAPEMELLREGRKLVARGGVLAQFPQARREAVTSSRSKQTAGEGTREAPTTWRVRARTLTYGDEEGRAQLEENVQAIGEPGEMRSRRLDLYLSAAGASRSAGRRELERAVATGGVALRSGAGSEERRGSAERAEYVAAEGKMILSGGRPTLFDAVRGTTTGRQLTFFLADDRIQVDSEEGSRTLTRHRVEK